MKLSPKQAEVMKWLNGGWTAVVKHGNAMTINGERICNRSTIEALQRKGLIKRVSQREWKAVQTNRGRS